MREIRMSEMISRKGFLWAAIAALALLAGCGESEPTPSVPNEHFGMVGEVYAYRDFNYSITGTSHLVTVPPIDPATNTDEIMLNALIHNYICGIYGAYDGRMFYRSSLALRLQFVSKRALAHTQLHFKDGVRVTEDLPEHLTGYAEKLIDGEWQTVDGVKLRIDNNSQVQADVDLPFLAAKNGLWYADIDFPIHDPGEYRLNYYFRDLIFDGLTASTGDELYTVSHTVTVPEPSEKKFDVVSVEMDGSLRNLAIGVLIRSNDGSIPYQDLAATTLEVSTPGGWQTARAPDGTPAVGLLLDYEQENPEISPTAYNPPHPFTDEEVTNLFAGTARLSVDGYSDARHRLTLEFCENEDGSGVRYALQLELDFSEGME